MKLSLTVLILLTAVACVPQLVISSPTRFPLPIVTATEKSVSSLVVSSTPLPACPCPSGVVTPSQSQSAGIGQSPIICNCPAILFPPTISATDVGSSSSDIPKQGITLADNGKSFIVHTGESFLLNLGGGFDWTVDIDNPNVLIRLKNVNVPFGAQGIYEADSQGQSSLTAVGDPFCRRAIPACEAPSILFKITVIVQ